MTKSMGRMNCRVVGLLGAMGMSLHLACWTFSAPAKVKEGFFAAYEKDQRPIELTFRMVDQSGSSASPMHNSSTYPSAGA